MLSAKGIVKLSSCWDFWIGFGASIVADVIYSAAGAGVRMGIG
jgi:hypothetical protein